VVRELGAPRTVEGRVVGAMVPGLVPPADDGATAFPGERDVLTVSCRLLGVVLPLGAAPPPAVGLLAFNAEGLTVRSESVDKDSRRVFPGAPC